MLMDILSIILSAVAILISVAAIRFGYITQKATMATLRKIEKASVLGAKASGSAHTMLNGQNPNREKIEKELQ